MQGAALKKGGSGNIRKKDCPPKKKKFGAVLGEWLGSASLNSGMLRTKRRTEPPSRQRRKSNKGGFFEEGTERRRPATEGGKKRGKRKERKRGRQKEH